MASESSASVAQRPDAQSDGTEHLAVEKAKRDREAVMGSLVFNTDYLWRMTFVSITVCRERERA